MSEPGHEVTESSGGRSTALWGGALVLAAAATVVLVLSGDARLLRLGLVAALWSALIGAFAVARLRDRVDEGERAAADRQRVYELELEREISARQEFEARAEAEAQRRARAESAAEIRSLQDELAKLRSTLEQVVGGDVLFERVALRAESTRVRSLAERGDGEVAQFPRAARSGEPRQVVAARQSEPQAPTQQVSMAAAQQAPGRPITAKPKPPPAPPASEPRSAPAAQPEGGSAASQEPKTEVISRISGSLDESRPRRPRPKQQFGQSFPDRPTPTRPERAPRRAEPAKPEPEDDSGAHAEGTSVDDLLAAYGGNSTQRRRRRRS
ncbi:DUF6779 domain-containing protein [Saccharopolyspora griseoalba]|uniref:DUF6779 domain-containing protein n=1 Tax=Saccharopolyspora griseoalba TaxID=1431848 RepID=A0ABW2LH58_9PSEU